MRAMDLKKYNKTPNSRRWSNKYPKDAHILALVVLAQKLADDSEKSYDESKRDPTKVEPAYIRYLPLWILEEPKWGVVNKNKDGKDY